jgi:hypothetical protein
VISIPNKAGDLVIFHLRVNHTATQKRVPAPPHEFPEERQKIAVFAAYGRNNAHVKAYHDYIASRPDYVYLKNFAYPEDLLSEAHRAGLILA